MRSGGPVGVAVGADHLLVDPPGHLDLDVLVVADRLNPYPEDGMSPGFLGLDAGLL